MPQIIAWRAKRAKKSILHSIPDVNSGQIPNVHIITIMPPGLNLGYVSFAQRPIQRILEFPI
jgi:hypothetical protein